MKPRRWILIISLLLAGFFLILFGVNVALENDRHLEETLHSYISPLVKGEFTVDKVRVGLLSVYLTGVRVTLPFKSMSLSIQNLKFSFSVLKLITKRFDIAQSIDRIILLEPAITIRITPFDTLLESSTREQNVSLFTKLYEKAVLVKGGTITLFDEKNNSVILGTKLHGSLRSNKSDMQLDLRGNCASLKQNLMFQALLNANNPVQKYRITVSQASIDKPFQWNFVRFGRGNMSCDLEVVSTDIQPGKMSMAVYGSMRLFDGTIINLPTDDTVRVSSAIASFDTSGMHIDSCFFRYKTMHLQADATVGFKESQIEKVQLTLCNFPIHSIPNMPDGLKNAIRGDALISCCFYSPLARDTSLWSLDIQGLYLNKQPIELASEGRYHAGAYLIDTINCRGKEFGLTASGNIRKKQKKLSYEVVFSLKAAGSTVMDSLHGDITATGALRGMNTEKPVMRVTINAPSLAYKKIPLSVVSLEANLQGLGIQFVTKNTEKSILQIRGAIDKLYSSDPSISAKIILNDEVIRTFLPAHDNAVRTIFKSLQTILYVEGSLFYPQINLYCLSNNPAAKGSITLSLSRNKKINTFQWRLTADSIYCKDSIVSIAGGGTVSHDTIKIDTMIFHPGVSLSGMMVADSMLSFSSTLQFDKVRLQFLFHCLGINNTGIKKGLISGRGKIYGNRTLVKSEVKCSVLSFGIGTIANLSADFFLYSKNREFSCTSFDLKQNGAVLVSVDSLQYRKGLFLSGIIPGYDLSDLFEKSSELSRTLTGRVSGRFVTKGTKTLFWMRAPKVSAFDITVDSVFCAASMDSHAVCVDTFTCVDSTGLLANASAFLPLNLLFNQQQERDTGRIQLQVTGDLVKSFCPSLNSALSGTGKGKIQASILVGSETWFIEKGSLSIPSGFLAVKPYVPKGISQLFLNASIDRESKLQLQLSGKIDKKPVQIKSSHDIPAGYQPLWIGPVNCGVLEMTTPKGGIELYLPGLLEQSATASIEVGPKPGCKEFTFSGPVEKFRMSGTLIVRDAEFTYPTLETEGIDASINPLDYINWDIDIKAGSKKVLYFYNLGGKKRAILRFTECFIDPGSSLLSIRGRIKDHTFKLLGSLRSYRGYAFYGRIFDRDFEVGVDFIPQKKPGGGYNNIPIIWGNAEAFSDTSRFDRIKLTLLTKDPVSGALLEKGRFHQIQFRLSSDFEDVPGFAERKFYVDAGLEFSSLKGAGTVFSGLSDQYLNRYFLQRIERRIARNLGLDVISLETSIASNYFSYFYANRNHGLYDRFTRSWDYLTFANVGLTIGQYFLHDRIFVKWKTMLVPTQVEQMQLKPKQYIGFEVQPHNFFWIDFNYGIYQDHDKLLKADPQLGLQLRIPLSRMKGIIEF